MNRILKSTKFVVDHADFVKINKDKINDFASTFTHEHVKHWLIESPYDISELDNEKKLTFLLIFNTMSFSYWGEPKWTIEYHGKNYDGAWGMIVALGRALEENVPILDFNFLSKIKKSELAEVLRGNTKIPLFEERWKLIRKVGRIITKKYNGNFSNLVRKANGDATKLSDLVIKELKVFDDVSKYKSKRIYFYKRAQLLVSDIYQFFGGKDHGALKNTEELTACADYKLPQVLRKLGILYYSPELAKKIDNKTQIHSDTNEEVEIRACTIWAIELIKNELKKRIPDIDAIHVNDHIWLAGQVKSSNDKPYHLTRTIAY